jgi:hypothetical protein
VSKDVRVHVLVIFQLAPPPTLLGQATNELLHA